MKYLYELRKCNLIPHTTNCIYHKIDIVKLTDKTLNSRIKRKINGLLWSMITLGKAKAYIIKDDGGKIIHSSYVITKCIKFPFMKRKGDIEIGPCFTSYLYRGQGLYPYVLSEIIKNELQNSDVAYMIVDEDNKASIKGVTKVGFTKTAKLRKDRFRRFVLDK